MPYRLNLYYYAYKHDHNELLPLVLLHGAGGDHLHWPVQIRRLAERRAYALDLPGHGKSGGHGLQSIEAYADHVREWMHEIHLPHAVIAGHSMGGAIALWMAVHYPERVQGLGLIGTGPHLPVNPQLLEDTAHPSTFPTGLDKITRWSFSESTDRKIRDLGRERMEEVRPSVLHGDLLACDQFDLREELDRVEAPSVVICGKEDKMTPPELSESLARGLNQAELELIPRAGHMVMIEKPARVAELLQRFTAGLNSPSP